MGLPVCASELPSVGLFQLGRAGSTWLWEWSEEAVVRKGRWGWGISSWAVAYLRGAGAGVKHLLFS